MFKFFSFSHRENVDKNVIVRTFFFIRLFAEIIIDANIDVSIWCHSDWCEIDFDSGLLFWF